MSRAGALAELLWSAGSEGGDVFALVDGAREPRLHLAVEQSQLEHACLYDGPLAPSLRRAAPYLVRLARDAAFTTWLADHGWGRAWGVYLAAPARLAEVRRHLRRFLLVADEDGRSLYFRFYDPRVLRTYLPTCNEAELSTVFGPIRRFWTESPDGERASEWINRGARAREIKRPLAQGPGGC